MQCSTNGSMFQLANAPVSPKGPIRRSKALSSYKCGEYCLQDVNCSSVSFEKNTCFIYGQSQDNIYELVRVNNSVIWSTKLCVKGKNWKSNQFSPVIFQYDLTDISTTLSTRMCDHEQVRGQNNLFCHLFILNINYVRLNW